jgi:predicted membrane-bound dolichyl-phosphate-mannose-protein mannosyltransferase
MSQSTGLILAIGGITLANESVFNDKPVNWRIPIATAIAALAFSAVETLTGPAVPRGVALVALVAVLFTRTDPAVQSPVESALNWWNRT